MRADMRSYTREVVVVEGVADKVSAAQPSAVMHIALLDNDPITLKGLSRIIEQSGVGTVVWSVQRGREAVLRCCDVRTRPQLLLVDMSLEGMTGVDVCRQIRRRTAAVALLGITAFTPEQYADRLAQAGAQGVVTKNDEEQIVQAVRSVVRGGVWGGEFEPPSVAHIRLKHSADDMRLLLSDREEEAMILISKGLTIAEAAQRMAVASPTAASYVNRARRKLGARKMREAVAIWTGEIGD
jgi:DNA-binding NarL/FixJ family response regulator